MTEQATTQQEELSMSEEEKAELVARPMGSQDLTGMDVGARLSFARKFERHCQVQMFRDDAERHAVAKRYPFWGFYIGKNSPQGLPFRVFACLRHPEIYLHCCTLAPSRQLMRAYVKPEMLKRVEHWSQSQLVLIHASPFAHLFLDPLAWTDLVPNPEEATQRGG